MKRTLNRGVLLASLALFSIPINSIGQTCCGSSSGNQLKVTTIAEIGFLSVLDHKIQFGKNGTYIDYNENGGQDVLFPFGRISINTQWKRNTFVLLYQPLRLESTELSDRSITIDSLTFPRRTAINYLYDFPFYRFSYLYDLTKVGGKWDVGVGISFQIRNATISFESTDGSLYRTNRDVGFVPALKSQINYRLNDKFFLGTELDGIYAPVSYLNGDNNDVTGAILDASIRAGYTPVKKYALFLNVRYLGGGANGQSDNYEYPSDGYVKNWLHFLIISTGFVWNVF
jgi:hypothetical protein